MIPLAGDAKTLEFLALHIKPFFGVGAAFAAEGDHFFGMREVRLLFALRAVVLFFDLPFDRQAMAVPARNIDAVLARHALTSGDKVLENFVQRMADMNVAVGVRRTIVQREFGPADRRRAHFFVEADHRPAPQEFRFAFWQAGAHRKARFRQIEGFGVIGSFGTVVHEGRPEKRQALKRGPERSG